MPYKDPEKRRACQRRYDERRRKSLPVSLAKNRASLGYCKPSLAPTQHPTSLDIAWAARIYEGEGCCKLTKAKKANGQIAGSSIYVSVAQKDTWILVRLKTLFGGSIGKGNQVCSAWRLSGARARGFMYTIFAWLSPRRREQFKRAMQEDKLYSAVPVY